MLKGDSDASGSENKRLREHHDMPEYWIYFAKPEERQHFDSQKHRLKLVDSSSFDAGIAEYYKLEESSLFVGVFNGSLQGAGFPLDFLRFLHSGTRPTAVIMCGICAGLGNVKPGDVCVGDSSMVMQGKAKGMNFTTLELERVSPASATLEHGATAYWTTLGEVLPDFKVHVGTFIQAPFVMAFDLNYLTGLLNPGDRKLIALDMESWFYFHVQAYLQQQLILPVVKGVSDTGSAKNDNFHAVAINNSVAVALRILAKVSNQQSLTPLKAQGHKMTNVSITTKRRKTDDQNSRSKTVTRAEARAALQEGLEDEEERQSAFQTLDNVLRKTEFVKLGFKNLRGHKNHFSQQALEILAKLIERDLSEIIDE